MTAESEVLHEIYELWQVGPALNMWNLVPKKVPSEFLSVRLNDTFHDYSSLHPHLWKLLGSLKWAKNVPPEYHFGAWTSVPWAFVVKNTVCHPCCLSVKYILGQWLRLTAEIRLLEVESLLYQYASLSPALHWLCSHTGAGISDRSVWTKKWVETGLSAVYNPLGDYVLQTEILL